MPLSSSGRTIHLRAVAIALGVTFLWSSSWVLVRWGLDQESLEPITFAGLRYGLAALVLVGWVASRRSLRRNLRELSRRAIAQIVVLGVLFYALTQGAQFVAIDSQPAATTSLVLSWTPLLVALLGGRSIAEAASRRQLVGTLLVVGGAWLYLAGDIGASAVGMAAAGVALGSNVVSTLLGRHVNRQARFEPVVVTALSMSVGALLLAAAGAVAEDMPPISARGWVIIFWLALVNTALAFTLWNLALRRLTALESAAINNTMLVQIAFLAWIALDEALGYRELAGIALVSAGVFMTQSTAARRAAPPGPR